MSETGMILSNPYRGERRAGSVGLPMSGVEVQVAPEGGCVGEGGGLRGGGGLALVLMCDRKAGGVCVGGGAHI